MYKIEKGIAMATALPQRFLEFYSRLENSRRFRSLWDLGDWLAYFDERAAVAEYDANVPRDDAEASAMAQCVDEWRRQRHEHEKRK